jgi:very-short-patch-repair endonuclease
MATKTRSEMKHRLAEAAAGQFGVLSLTQLHGLGMSDSAIKHAVRTGRLHPVLRGVYALGRARIGQHGHLFAATLACGKGAIVSHRSAAALMGLLDRAPVLIDVISPNRCGRGIDGIRWHDVRRPQPWEMGTFERIPCTSPARTFVDLAGEVGVRTLRSCFERAAARKLLDLEAVEVAIGPGGRPGTRDLRALLEEWRPAAPTVASQRLKSPLEAMVLPLLAKRGLQAPRCNAPVDLVEGRIEVDFLWPEQRFVLEADSRDFHATDVAFERDRWRDRELMRVAYTVLRVTRLQAETEAQAVADAIAARVG